MAQKSNKNDVERDLGYYAVIPLLFTRSFRFFGRASDVRCLLIGRNRRAGHMDKAEKAASPALVPICFRLRYLWAAYPRK